MPGMVEQHNEQLIFCGCQVDAAALPLNRGISFIDGQIFIILHPEYPTYHTHLSALARFPTPAKRLRRQENSAPSRPTEPESTSNVQTLYRATVSMSRVQRMAVAACDTPFAVRRIASPFPDTRRAATQKAVGRDSASPPRQNDDHTGRRITVRLRFARVPPELYPWLDWPV